MKSVMWWMYAAAVGWTGSVWFTGLGVERAYGRVDPQALTGEYLNVQVKSRRFERHFLHSEATWVLRVRPDPCQPPFELTVRETFHNNILLSLGVVQSEVELEWPVEIRRGMQEMLDGKSGLHITGRHRLDGESTYHAESPAMRLKFGQDGVIDWKGLRSDWVIMPAKKSSSYTLQSDGMDVYGGGHQWLGLGKMSLAVHDQQTPAGVDTGDSALQLERLQLLQLFGKGQKLEFRDMHVENHTVLQSGMVNVSMEYRLGDAGQGGEESFGSSGSFAFNGLDVQAVKDLRQAMREAGNTCKPDFKAVMAGMSEVFGGSSELLIKRLELRFGDKKMRLDGHLRGMDFSRSGAEAFSSLYALQQSAAYRKLDIGLHLHLNDAAMAERDAGLGQRHGLLQSLPGAESLKHEQGEYSAELTLKDGEFRINGQPWRSPTPSFPDAPRLDGSEPYTPGEELFSDQAPARY